MKAEFSRTGLADFHDALHYYGVVFPNRDVCQYAEKVVSELQALCNRPLLLPVVYTDDKTGFQYRHLRVWKFYYFYRISRENLLVDAVAHEASSAISRSTDL